MTIRIKRVYEPKGRDDGARVLVDRLWPRGVSKPEAAIDHWLKEIAPSPVLRKWFGHDSSKWTAFRSRYFEELDANAEAVERLAKMAQCGVVTLLFGARDLENNHAVALRDYMLRRHVAARAASGASRPANRTSS